LSQTPDSAPDVLFDPGVTPLGVHDPYELNGFAKRATKYRV
jgi:hypothetical protein